MGRVLVLLALAVVACGRQPNVGSSTPPGISFRFEGDDITQANQRAATYCRQYARSALLQKVERDGNGTIAVYDCS